MGGRGQLRQLQAELSTAHTRVAELEAQAAQDKPVALEASHYEAGELKWELKWDPRSYDGLIWFDYFL